MALLGSIEKQKIVHELKTTPNDFISIDECLKSNDEHFMILDVISSAGTYIKEFVHSDLMRTEPSIKSLLDCDVDILQLDVRDLILLDEINK